jgi:hypothetical protein
MKNMLSEALREIRGLLNQLLTNLEGDDGAVWLVELKKFLRKEKTWTGEVAEKPKPLLGPAVIVANIPATTSQFVVQKEFAKYRGSNFDSWFLGKVEEPTGEGILRCQRLQRNSKDSAIIANLGGSLKARITLADINTAKEGGALKKDEVYIGYVEDEVRFPADEEFAYINEKGKRCVLRAVHVDWSGGGWDARANSVDALDEWDVGDRVLSRNSLES